MLQSRTLKNVLGTYHGHTQTLTKRLHLAQQCIFPATWYKLNHTSTRRQGIVLLILYIKFLCPVPGGLHYYNMRTNSSFLAKASCRNAYFCSFKGWYGSRKLRQNVKYVEKILHLKSKQKELSISLKCQKTKRLSSLKWQPCSSPSRGRFWPVSQLNLQKSATW